MQAMLALIRSGGCGRGDLRDQALERLIRLLREIGVEPGDLLRIRHEGFISRLREFGLCLKRLVQRLRSRKLLDEGPGLFERFFGVVAVGSGDCLKAAVNRGRRRDDGFEMFFAVLLNVSSLIITGCPSETVCT